ncbi:hypothetical protein EMCRGX_G002101 [Ephydatia muelleri]
MADDEDEEIEDEMGEIEDEDIYSLFEPNSRTLAEYGVSLEKAILRDSELLSEVNNAFCNSHPLLAQKVVTRSARAAVSKISADALLACHVIG